jgi:sigma-B regulation protein RsbU (phosphoserine phosphatase)
MPAEKINLPGSDELFETAPCGLVVTTESGQILRANSTFATWIGFSLPELLGRRFQDLLTVGGRIFHQTHWAPLIRMQGSVAEVKLELKRRDGHIITVILNGVRREVETGAVLEMALFTTTDRDKYERELLGARRAAEELLHEKTTAENALREAQAELSIAYEKAERRAQFAEQMVAIASHDLKNPLTAIKMATDMLARGERSPKENQLLGHITRSSERAQRMIADLLDFALARVGHGISIALRTVDFHQVTAQSVSELRIAFPQANLVHQHSGTGTANIDPDRLHQLIGNLIANSVAYGDVLRPITVTSVLEQSQATMTVHNEGPAIPDSLLAVLFEPMTRGSERDDDVRSVGLGLFIVSEIAKTHGGSAQVTSLEAKGTSFSVTFPFQNSEFFEDRDVPQG